MLPHLAQQVVAVRLAAQAGLLAAAVADPPGLVLPPGCILLQLRHQLLRKLRWQEARHQLTASSGKQAISRQALLPLAAAARWPESRCHHSLGLGRTQEGRRGLRCRRQARRLDGLLARPPTRVRLLSLLRLLLRLLLRPLLVWGTMLLLLLPLLLRLRRLHACC